MSRYAGRVAVVTGSARGIGAATARGSPRRVRRSPCSTWTRTPPPRPPPASAPRRPIGLACDVSDAASVEAAVAAVVEQLGQVDVLVNNAGVTRDNLLFKMTEDDWDAVMGVHLKGSFLMSREVQKHMVAAKYGKILNLSAVSALGNRGQANYSAAKMGLQGFTRTLALELGPVRDQRQRDRPRLHRHRHDRRDRAPGRHGAGGVPQGAPPPPPRCAGSATRRTSPRPRRSCAATRRRSSPARRCTSTVAPRSEHDTRALQGVVAAGGRPLSHTGPHGWHFPLDPCIHS